MLPLTLRRPVQELAVPIHALLDKQQETEGVVLSPEEVTAIVAGYEAALQQLKVPDRKAPMALLVAKTVIQIASEGERDPERLCERVIRLYRVNRKPKRR
jgi:hypothetical protein